MIFLLVVICIAGYFIYKRHEKKALEKEIKMSVIEKEALIKLMKKAQDDRFNKNSISGIVYNTRMNKYQEKLLEIKQKINIYLNTIKSFGE